MLNAANDIKQLGVCPIAATRLGGDVESAQTKKVRALGSSLDGHSRVRGLSIFVVCDTNKI